jgi:hypothetical protein
LRRLSGTYSGKAIRVRRTDLQESDIGFTALGELDTTALLAFTGTGALNNGFVTTWYDQSGNGYNATQTTALNQPQIVSSGSIIFDNQKPSLIFNGTSSFLSANSVASFLSGDDKPYSWFINTTFNQNTSITRQTVSMTSNLTNTPLYNFLRQIANGGLQSLQAFLRADNNQNSATIITNITINTNYLQTIISTGTTANYYQNNINVKTVNYNLNSITVNLFDIGARLNTASEPFSGFLKEIILYPSSQSSNRTGIETNINDFYSIY